ncbi:hypothetical protein ABZV67_10695 [Streptomyces sp. NPDC005065]|uniref:hypothetical protein n=1 Tax=Streptomyces sp. NPDC005065 TaxID=3154461 RepID=UPI0033AD89D5
MSERFAEILAMSDMELSAGLWTFKPADRAMVIRARDRRFKRYGDTAGWLDSHDRITELAETE